MSYVFAAASHYKVSGSQHAFDAVPAFPQAAAHRRDSRLVRTARPAGGRCSRTGCKRPASKAVPSPRRPGMDLTLRTGHRTRRPRHVRKARRGFCSRVKAAPSPTTSTDCCLGRGAGVSVLSAAGCGIRAKQQSRVGADRLVLCMESESGADSLQPDGLAATSEVTLKAKRGTPHVRPVHLHRYKPAQA